MKIINSMILLAFLGFVNASYADDIKYRLNIGFWTEHYVNDSPDYNENNKLLQITVAKNDRFITAATFNNSHDNDCELLGIGLEDSHNDNLRTSYSILAINGYEGDVKTHYKGLLFTPAVGITYHHLTLSIIPVVMNVGFELEF